MHVLLHYSGKLSLPFDEGNYVQESPDELNYKNGHSQTNQRANCKLQPLSEAMLPNLHRDISTLICSALAVLKKEVTDFSFRGRLSADLLISLFSYDLMCLCRVVLL